MKATVAAAFPLFSLALGAVNWSAFESCVTESGTSSVKTVPTSMSTTTVQQPDVFVKHTYHPQQWVTPRPFTRTWTHTFQETNTAVSTVTISLTHTELVPTSTSVVKVTQTHVSNVYTTIPAPAGFLPVSNTTNSAYPGPQSHSSGSSSASSSSSVSPSSSSTAASLSSSAPYVSSTAAAHYNATASASGASAQNASATLAASADLEARGLKDIKQFAHLVHCLKSVLVQKTVDTTITGSTQTSTLAQATSTITVSTTTTTMVQPKWGHGKTVYTTAWTTVTKGYVARSTQTATAEVTSTIKAYAACQTNNVLRPVASLSNKAKYKTTVASSAQKCCEQCQETNNCIGSAYQELLPIGGRCLIYYANSCPAQSANSVQYFTPSPKAASYGTFAVSNGLCGYLYSGGQAATHGFGF